MPSITKINELDRKIQGNLNRLDSSMHKIVKTLETIKFHDLESSRIDKIEEVINTLGTTFSSIKIKKEETPMNIEAFKQVSLNDITTTLIDSSDLDFDNCTLIRLKRIYFSKHFCYSFGLILA